MKLRCKFCKINLIFLSISLEDKPSLDGSNDVSSPTWNFNRKILNTSIEPQIKQATSYYKKVCQNNFNDSCLYSSKEKMSSVNDGSRKMFNKYSSEEKFSNFSKIKYSKKNRKKRNVKIIDEGNSVDKMDYFYGPYRKDFLSKSVSLHFSNIFFKFLERCKSNEFRKTDICILKIPLLKKVKESNPHWQSIAECIFGKDKDSKESFTKVIKKYTSSVKRELPNEPDCVISPLESTILRIKKKIGKQEKRKVQTFMIKESYEETAKSYKFIGSKKNLKKIQNNPIFSSTVDKINKFFPANAASCGKRGDGEFFQMSKEEDSNISRADKDNKERLNKRFDFRPINEGRDDLEKEIVDNDEANLKLIL
ncbi:unnamed protein product [Moneuplotes crassus]|uniref:Uncharacterized protein n=1 Tax=Euplotes crassus TaxID=5936 RepID=A0AAD1Y8N4_EUPCR|nr:unnamed protein product [Moneuplotes crassus]